VDPRRQTPKGRGVKTQSGKLEGGFPRTGAAGCGLTVQGDHDFYVDTIVAEVLLFRNCTISMDEAVTGLRTAFADACV
jgi:hypothetical protein